MKQLKCRTHMNNEIEEKEVRSKIERIHDNKHNMIPIVKLVVYQPIVFLLKPGVLTSDVSAEVLNELPEIKKRAERVMMTLKEIGNVPSEDIHIQLEQLEQQIDDIIKTTVPEIKQIVDFYSEIAAKDYYFTTIGQEAQRRLFAARDNCDVACKALKTLKKEQAEASYVNCNLFQVIEKVFDGDSVGFLKAMVIYDGFDRDKEYCVKMDIETFSHTVLMNIKHNIENHAFPVSKNDGVMIWEKKVKIDILEDDSFVRISIANNGEPFNGDVSKVFDYGYCFGPTRHTGFGLDSAKKYMDSIEGKIEMITSSDSEYKVTYLITLKKNNHV